MGSLGLLATCAFYVVAGPEAALPGGAAADPLAMAATTQVARWMRLAGLAGMPSDVLLAVGALLLALHQYARRTPVTVAGWLALAIASLLFIVVDAMVAMVLPRVAMQANAEAAYAGLRALFDVLFTIGTWTAGCGALAVSWRTDGMLFQWPVVGWAMRVAGVACLVSATTHLIGWPGAPLIGPSIALLALASIGAARVYATGDGAGKALPEWA
jgi:hypothetical protein